MPDRVLRDELLTSERYWSVSIEAQRLFVHLLLVVDDAARFSGKNFSIRTACFPGQAVSADKLEKMLSELADEDLIRLYVIGGERFIFIPRFRNRRRYIGSSRYPEPPKEINDITSGKADLGTTEDRPKTGASQSKVRPKTRGVGVGEGKNISPVGFDTFWTAYPKKVDKPLAIEQWKKLADACDCLPVMLAAIADQRRSLKWSENGGKFIEYPAKWLKGRRWETSTDANSKPWEH